MGMAGHVEMNLLHMTLLRDVSKVVHDFTKKHPEVDSMEVVAMFGVAAAAFISSAPEEYREIAIESVINTMRDNVADFVNERIIRGETS
jgi:hypothetical protein